MVPMYQIHGIFLSMFTPSEFALWMALREPPTQTGSGEVLCVVVAELDPATTRLDASTRSVKCRPRESG